MNLDMYHNKSKVMYTYMPLRMKTKKDSPEMCLREVTKGLKLNITMIGSWRTWDDTIINIR